jgi:membrane protease YdiL (CAAX protease family)
MSLDRLRDILSRWPTWAEVLIVAVGAFGLPILGAIRYLSGSVPGAAITELRLRSLLIHEPIVLVLVGGFLYLRGWTPQRLTLPPRSIDALIGLGLALGIYAAYVVLWTIAAAARLQPMYPHGATALVSGHIAMVTAIAVCILNPFFEEIFVCGYVITVAKEHGHPAIGINTSVAIRLAYHLYQGGVGVVAIVPFGLIMAIWYSRTQRLWPVLIAHALNDFVALIEVV